MSESLTSSNMSSSVSFLERSDPSFTHRTGVFFKLKSQSQIQIIHDSFWTWKVKGVKRQVGPKCDIDLAIRGSLLRFHLNATLC